LQQSGITEQTRYAGLGFRFAAVMVDTLIVLLASSILLAVLSVTGVVDIGLRSGATLNDIYNSSRAAPGWLTPLEYCCFFLYFTLFELTGITPGKRVFRLTVARDDGTRLTSSAVVIRNLIRIPEMYLLYAPSAIACLASSKNKRLGDLAARTVVLRRGAAPATADVAGSQTPAAPPPAPWTAPQPPGLPDLAESIAALKTASLAVAGAHRSYLHFSELELAAVDRTADAAHDYSPEYVAAWYTLTDAVAAAQKELAAAGSAASSAGTTFEEACADQPDLVRALREFGPYFDARSDDQIHDAYLRVARAETAT
jgi:uncharacterized RDD family membrane protein YckC